MGKNNTHKLEISHGIYFQCIYKLIYFLPQMYTNIHSHQHKIAQIAWNHQVYNFNIHTFYIWTVWRLIRISAKEWVHQQITFHHWSSHTFNYFILIGIPKYLAYSGKYSPFLLSNFTITLCLTMDCRNAQMKPN